MRVMTQTSVMEALGAEEPVGLLAIPAERAEQARKDRQAKPMSTSELLRRELGPLWARESRGNRREAVSRWLKDHTPGALLKLDIRAQKRSGGILAD